MLEFVFKWMSINHLSRPSLLVSYEGIQKLCFDCGCIGHRKESCPYSIRALAPLPRESSDRSTGLVDETCNSHEGDMADDGKESTTDDQESTYGPWLVVTRRRNGVKPAKKEWSVKGTEHDPRITGSAKVNSGVSSPSNFHVSSSGGPKNTISNGVLGQFGLGFVGNSSPTCLLTGTYDSKGGNGLEILSVTYPDPTKVSLSSVKSKKALARARPHLSYGDSNVGTSSGLQSFSPKSIVNSSSLPNNPPNPDGFFLFTRTPSTLMDNHCRRDDRENSGGDLGGGLSIPAHRMGWFKSRLKKARKIMFL